MSTIDALLDLARAHARQERLAEAEQCFREAVRLAPERDDALAALGLHLQRQSRHAEALPCFTRALAQAPGRADLHNNLGTLLAGLGREAEAEACFLRALRLRPDYAHALTNLGFLKQGRDEEAKSYFYRALASMPALAQARFNLSLSVLAEGDLAAGLFLYEYRPVLEELRRRQPSARPVWDGTAMPGKTLLLLQEQGYGDLIQTIRFAREIRPKVGRLVLKCDAAIAPLMRSAPDLDAVVSDDSALPPVDAYVSTMSLMHRLRITLATLPGGIPYLAAAPDRVARLAPHFAGEGFKVGIVWAGNPAHRSDHRRTLALSALAPLLTLEGVRFFSLQFGPPAEALRQSGLAITDLTPALHDFADTAAALRHLDLVIAVDTALIHLAGALGVPAFLLCPRPADWRWLRERDDSPWYPSLTLFRQERVGDWAPVIERVAKALQARAHSHLGHLAANQNRPHEAAVHFARALLTRPTDATLHHALGLAMNTMSRLPEAELCFRRSLARRPDYREALTHLGHVLGRQNRFAEAEAWHRRALALEPGSADALTQLGITFHVQDRLAEAKELYRRALSLAPDQFIARLNLGYALLAEGDFRQGLPLYETRLEAPALRRTLPSATPLWDGTPIEKGTLLLWDEQGFGDILQCARFAKPLKARVGRLVLRCPDPLREVMESVEGIDAVVSIGAPLPPHDAYLPIMSTMHRLALTEERIPAPFPTLAASISRIQRLASLFAGDHFKLGLVWAGSPMHQADHRRSLSKELGATLLDRLAHHPGVKCFSLQVGPRQGEIEDPGVTDLAPLLGNFADTAAAISLLDLVISVDTATAHLAGAMGKPTWLMLPFSGDWRWGRAGATTRWYPSLRLYRQAAIGEWLPVIERLAQDFKRLLAA